MYIISFIHEEEFHLIQKIITFFNEVDKKNTV
jgi:hypothetical protein